MEEQSPPFEKDNNTFFNNPFQPEFAWRNLIIGIAVVVVVIFFIYLGVSQSIKSSDYKSMDLSTKNQNNSGSVAGAATSYGPPDRPAGAVVPTTASNTTPTPAPKATSTPVPTSAPEATATPQPTATPTPAPTATNTPTPTDTPTPTATPAATPTDIP